MSYIGKDMINKSDRFIMNDKSIQYKNRTNEKQDLLNIRLNKSGIVFQTKRKR